MPMLFSRTIGAAVDVRYWFSLNVGLIACGKRGKPLQPPARSP
jgi:hypothetical protein